MKNKLDVLITVISFVVLIVPLSLCCESLYMFTIISKLPRGTREWLMRIENETEKSLKNLYSFQGLDNDFLASADTNILEKNLGTINWLTSSPNNYSELRGILSDDDITNLRHAFYDTMRETSEKEAVYRVRTVPYKKIPSVLKRQTDLCEMLKEDGIDCDKKDLSLRKIAHDRLHKQIIALDEANQKESDYLEKEGKASDQRILKRKQEQQELSKIIQEIE